ncbi:cupin [Shewanella sp. Pdp11]|uniref:cupin domain-containing protein n=1 Tax=Shewanella sp. Pdp11 TaxID=2059264 RepID=UPI000CA10282|nr:cupin domain-containing protein [Shewanella sp. Pdp11]AUD61670.1 cupin [Shewanella sp. Pdp11]
MLDNFFAKLPTDLSAEVFEKLAGNDSVTIERIVSNGQYTPDGQWYDQTQHEWVMLLKGDATFEFEQGEPVTLTPGDYLTIPPHQKHRVASTSISSETLWLAVFYD